MAAEPTTGGTLRTVLAVPALRRAELAWAVGITGEWTTTVALLVVAYQQLGVAGAGLFGIARSLPAGIAAPFLAGIADRATPERVLLFVHGGRALVTLAMLTGQTVGVPIVAILIMLVPLEGMLAVLHRPTNFALLPGLARDPRELVAANVLASTGEGLGVLVGPALGGLIAAAVSPSAALLAGAVAAGIAALLIRPVRPAVMAVNRPAKREGAIDAALGGIRAIVARPAVFTLVAIAGAQTFVRGVLTVLLVAASVSLFGLGESGVGYLTAAIGAGGLIGALGAVGLVGRRLGPVVVIGLIVWGLPIAALGVVPLAFVGFVMMFAVGVANAAFDVAVFTLLQRSVPNALRGRVFGALEALIMLSVALGSLVGPLIVEGIGLRTALVATGLLLPVVALIVARRVRAIEGSVVVSDRSLALLKGVPSFAPLPLTILETLGGSLEPSHLPPGTELIRQGGVGDRFYILEKGRADVSIDGEVIRQMGPGDSFGEIALLRDVARTATVRTTEASDVLALDRGAFLSAISGARAARTATERVVETRIGEGR